MHHIPNQRRTVHPRHPRIRRPWRRHRRRPIHPSLVRKHRIDQLNRRPTSIPNLQIRIRRRHPLQTRIRVQPIRRGLPRRVRRIPHIHNLPHRPVTRIRILHFIHRIPHRILQPDQLATVAQPRQWPPTSRRHHRPSTILRRKCRPVRRHRQRRLRRQQLPRRKHIVHSLAELPPSQIHRRISEIVNLDELLKHPGSSRRIVHDLTDHHRIQIRRHIQRHHRHPRRQRPITRTVTERRRPGIPSRRHIVKRPITPQRQRPLLRTRHQHRRQHSSLHIRIIPQHPIRRRNRQRRVHSHPISIRHRHRRIIHRIHRQPHRHHSRLTHAVKRPITEAVAPRKISRRRVRKGTIRIQRQAPPRHRRHQHRRHRLTLRIHIIRQHALRRPHRQCPVLIHNVRIRSHRRCRIQRHRHRRRTRTQHLIPRPIRERIHPAHRRTECKRSIRTQRHRPTHRRCPQLRRQHRPRIRIRIIR